VAGGAVADNDDPAEAAIRLEEALERIARLAHRLEQRSPATDSAPSAIMDPDTGLIAARLDMLIAQLRAALNEAPRN
jgi:HAMP domain-containing protein